MKKEQTVYSMALVIFQAEARKGHLKWNVTEVVKTSGFSRSLVYRYMGRSKAEMLKSALSVFTDHFYGFTPSTEKLSFSERIREARRTVIENPQVSVFYQKWRHQKSWVQEEFIKTEKLFKIQLQKSLPHMTETQISMVHSIVHGLVTAPFLSAEEAYLAAQEVETQFLNRA